MEVPVSVEARRLPGDHADKVPRDAAERQHVEPQALGQERQQELLHGHHQRICLETGFNQRRTKHGTSRPDEVPSRHVPIQITQSCQCVLEVEVHAADVRLQEHHSAAHPAHVGQRGRRTHAEIQVIRPGK